MGVAVVAAPQSRLLTWQEQQWANELDMTGVEALLAPVTGIATPLLPVAGATAETIAS